MDGQILEHWTSLYLEQEAPFVLPRRRHPSGGSRSSFGREIQRIDDQLWHMNYTFLSVDFLFLWRLYYR